MNFKSYIGIDYSGAAKPETRSTTIQVYAGSGSAEPVAVASPASTLNRRRNWNRAEVASWLIERLQQPERCIVGIDHGFSFPMAYFDRNQLENGQRF